MNHFFRVLTFTAIIPGCITEPHVGINPENIGNPTLNLLSRGGMGLTIALCLAIICATIAFVKLLSRIH